MSNKANTRACKSQSKSEKPIITFRRAERGNMFMALFGAVAVVGVLGATIMSVMRGPLSTMVEVNRREQAKAESRVIASLVLQNASTSYVEDTCLAGASGDDNPDDSQFTEAPAPATNAFAPTGGGQISGTIGAKKTDPWGNAYGYCAWNHGPISDACASGNILEGENSTGAIALAIISAGPNGSFDTGCYGSGATDPYVYPYDGTNNGGGDDIVVSMTYDQAGAATGGSSLWTDNTGSTGTIDSGSAINVTDTSQASTFSGSARFGQSVIANVIEPIDATSGAQYVTFGNAASTETYGIKIGEDVDAGQCAAAGDMGILRITAGGELQMCDGSSFSAVGGKWIAGATTGEIYYNLGNVGVGSITDPGRALDVGGTFGATGDVAIGNTNAEFTIAGATGNTDIAGTLDVEGLLSANGDLDVTDVLNVIAGAAGSFNVVDGSSNTQFSVDGSGAVSNPNGTLLLDDSTLVSVDLEIASSATDDTPVFVVSNDSGGTPTDVFEIQADGDITTVGDLDVSGDVTISPSLTVTGSAASGDTVILDIRNTGGSAFNVDHDGDVVARNINAGDIDAGRIDATDLFLDTSKNLDPGGACTTGQYSWWDGDSWECGDDITGSSGGSAGSVKLNDVEGADGTSDEDHGANLIKWNWNSLTSTQGLAIESTSMDDGANLVGIWSDNTTGDSTALYAGTNTAGSGYGAFFEAWNTSGYATAVGASNRSTTDTAAAITAKALGTSGATYGVYATNDSTTAAASAVYGAANGASGATYGVYGSNASATGYGGYFTNTNSGLSLYTTTGYTMESGVLRLEGGAGNQAGCIQYDDTTDDVLKFSDDCVTYQTIGEIASADAIWTPASTNDYIEYDDLLGGVRIASVTGQPAPLTDWSFDTSNSIVYTDNKVVIGDSAVSGSLSLDVEGPVGATQYCDEDGDDCFTAATIAGIGGGGSAEEIDDLTDAIYSSYSLHIGVGSGANDDFSGGGNVTVGRDSSTSITTQSGNVVVGHDSNKSHTGNNNLVFGNNSLNGTGTGAGNIAVGHYTLGAVTGGYDNLAIGSGALNSLTGGNTNVAIGKDSGSSTSGSSNTMIGAYAGSGLSSGGENVFVGRAAGSNVGAGAGNVLLGYQAGDNISGGGSNIIIGNNIDALSAGGSSQLNIGNTIYGDLSTDRIGIGASPATDIELDVTGDIKLSATLLLGSYSSIGAPVASGSGSALNDISAADDTATIDNEDNPIVWNWATTGADTDAFTFGESTASAATGSASILKATTLVSSTATAMMVTNLGDGDSFRVNDATGDTDSTPFVIKADGTVIVGSTQMNDTGTGSEDNRMFFEPSTGAFRAGQATSTQWNSRGDGSIALGRGVTASSTGSIAIGNFVTAGTGEDNLVLGYDTEVTGNRAIAIGVGNQSGGDNPIVSADESMGIFLGDNSDVDISASQVLAIMGGNVGIKNAAPDVELDVTGDIEYTGTLTDVSDMRLKENIEPLSQHGSLIEKIDAIDTYSFTMKDDASGRIEFGVMAQELEKIFPELVHTAKDEMSTKSVNYVGLIAPIIEATKELKAENDSLKAELAEMRETQHAMLETINGLQIHTGYGVNKAQIGLWMLLGMVGTAVLMLFGSTILQLRKKEVK